VLLPGGYAAGPTGDPRRAAGLSFSGATQLLQNHLRFSAGGYALRLAAEGCHRGIIEPMDAIHNWRKDQTSVDTATKTKQRICIIE
jgi:hypothetical protein